MDWWMQAAHGAVCVCVCMSGEMAVSKIAATPHLCVYVCVCVCVCGRTAATKTKKRDTHTQTDTHTTCSYAMQHLMNVVS